MDSIHFGKMFSSDSVDDLDKAYDFYSGTLGLQVTREEMGILSVRLSAGGQAVMIYPKPDHEAAAFTVMNLEVADLEPAVDALTAKGVVFEQYHTKEIETDEKGISKGEQGPSIAWFRDPAGNILSVMKTHS